MPDAQQRKLAAIVFADVAGYTALMQQDEQLALQKLSRFKETLEHVIPDYHGTLVQYYGDGCLMMFTSSVDAVSFCITVQQAFREDPRLPVRMGIHTGDVLVKEGLVYGDAVNITSRIESMGVPGSVLLSQSVRGEIKNKPEFIVSSLGFFDFKNVATPIEVFALAHEGFPVPKRDEIEAKLNIRKPAEKKFMSMRSIALMLIFILLAGAALIFYLNKHSARLSGEQSIAILPLRNLSGDPGQDYFADGVVEAIHSKLARIGTLRVTSMTSMLGYRHQSKSIPDIAREVRVQHILEGSVSKNQDEVRIVIRLVGAKEDRQLWTETYDRQLTDIFTIQSDIAQAVANALRMQLSADEKGMLSKLEVSDITAYDLYLSSLNGFYDFKATLDTAFNESAHRKALRAIRLDPTYDDAFVLAANTWYGRKDYGFGNAAVDSADQYAIQSVRLNPDNSDALYIRGLIEWERAHYPLSRDLTTKALDITPSHGPALRLLANYYMHESETVEQSIPLLIKAITLDPNNQQGRDGIQSTYLDLGQIYVQADLLKEAKALFQKALDISSERNRLMAYTSLGYVSYVSGQFDNSIQYRRQQLNLAPDDFGAINEYAGANYAAGRYDEAEKYYRKLQALLEQGYLESHRSFIFRHRLAHILLMTGRKEEAKRLLDEHLRNELTDLKAGTRHFGQEYAIAGAYAVLGDKKNAYAWLSKMPFWYITYQFSRVDPLFASLRGEKQFEEIMRPHQEKMNKLQSAIQMLESDGQLKVLLEE